MVNKIQQIQELYKGLKNGTKGIVRRELADAINDKYDKEVIKSITIKNHWFTDDWAIPVYHQDFTLEFLTNKIAEQNEKVS